MPSSASFAARLASLLSPLFGGGLFALFPLLLSASPARVWIGETPQMLRSPHSICWLFPQYEVKETPYLLQVKRRGGTPCLMRAEDRLFFSALHPKRRFVGLTKGLVFLRGESSQAAQFLEIYSLLLGKMLFKKTDIPKESKISFDASQFLLFLQDNFLLPSFCPRVRQLLTFEKQWKLCWPRIQRTYEAFRKVKLPACSCPQSASPYLLAEIVIEISHKNALQKLTGKLLCSCTS